MGWLCYLFGHGVYLAFMNKVQVKNGWYIFLEDFYDAPAAKKLYDDLLDNLPWKSGEIKLFGKVHAVPRKQVYFSDDNLNYSYSGKQLDIDPWDERMLSIKKRLETELGTPFNACLANLYRNGLDSNGWHADDEKELGVNPLIASLSFGTTRRFDLKHTLTNEKISFELNTGSLLVMGGEIQHFWKHQIPKQKKIESGRINLTFRNIFEVA